MKLEYKIKGVTLDEKDILEVHEFYKQYVVAEYIMENYKASEETAWLIAADVIHYRDEHGYSEDEAIREALYMLVQRKKQTYTNIEDLIVYSDKQSIEKIMDKINMIISTYGCISVAVVIDLAGIKTPTNHIDTKYGWVSTDRFKINIYHDVAKNQNGYILAMPKPIALS